jgi:hypothetical protein
MIGNAPPTRRLESVKTGLGRLSLGPNAAPLVLRGAVWHDLLNFALIA